MTPTPQPQEAVIPSDSDEYQVWQNGRCVAMSNDRYRMERYAWEIAKDGPIEMKRMSDQFPRFATREAEAPVSEAVAWRWRQRMRDTQGGHEIVHGKSKPSSWVNDEDVSELTALFDHPAPSPASAWKPIETHEKSTDEVLLGWEDGTVLIGEWSRYLGCFDWPSSLHPAQDQPAHWMPLPTPPATEGSGE